MQVKDKLHNPLPLTLWLMVFFIIFRYPYQKIQNSLKQVQMNIANIKIHIFSFQNILQFKKHVFYVSYLCFVLFCHVDKIYHLFLKQRHHKFFIYISIYKIILFNYLVSIFDILVDLLIHMNTVREDIKKIRRGFGSTAPIKGRPPPPSSTLSSQCNFLKYLYNN